jgi:hypothetical protein
MSNRSHAVLGKFANFGVVLLSLVLCFSACSSKRAVGDRVVAEVKQFRQQHGHLPNSLDEIGEASSESGLVYYEKKAEDRYIIWYGTSLGESMAYDSTVGRWEAHN